MAKVVCDFKFDNEIYLVAAALDKAHTITGLEALGNVGKPRASDVHEQCALIGTLLESGLAFDYFEHATRLGPLTMSIVAACVRGRDQVVRALRSSAEAKLLEGAPQ